jgi:tetratricopeptide (TPR) repeat protein
MIHFILVGVLFLFSSGSASDFFPPDLSEGIKYYFQENFNRAEGVFSNLVQADTLHPLGYYFLAITYQAEMLDLESDFKAEQFKAAIEKSIQLSMRLLEENRNNRIAYLILGNSYGNWALHQARWGSWFSAFRLGLRAKDNWEKALELDSTFYEAYAGLGNYFYWKTVFTRRFSWLPFVKDKRKQGIRMLKLAAQNSGLSKEFALSSLMWINLKEKNYREALDLAFYFQSKYPQAKYPLWAEGFIYYEKFDWRNAILAFEKLLVSLKEAQPTNYYNLIEVEFRLANCYFNLGKSKEARLLCEKIMAYPLDKKTKERQKEKLKKTRELLNKINRQIK